MVICESGKVLWIDKKVRKMKFGSYKRAIFQIKSNKDLTVQFVQQMFCNFKLFTMCIICIRINMK